MRKYFTWRCISLHAVTLILVPAFLLAGWWQYRVALSGNGLSWVYTVEWPAFALYAIYMWWQLIHDRYTPFDRLWAAKERAAADASGRPLHQIPGWALDKTLSQAVIDSSLEAARALELSEGNKIKALESQLQKSAYATRITPELGDTSSVEGNLLPPDDGADEDPNDRTGQVIDARVLEVKVVVNEELDKYNRYLAELSWRDPPKRWGLSRNPKHNGSDTKSQTRMPAPVVPFEGQHLALPSGELDTAGENPRAADSASPAS